MKDERISVVVPVYNTPAVLLRKCVDSLRQQTDSNFEVLVVDDGTPQPLYGDLMRQYAEDERIHFLRKENGGVSSARNFGMEHAQGQYLAFVDSDDYVEPDFLLALREAVQDADLAICGVLDYGDVANALYDQREFFSKPSRFTDLQYINFPVNKLYRMSIIRKYGLSFPVEVKLGEDALFLASYFPHCTTIHCINRPLYHYVVQSGSALQGYQPQFWNWETDVIDRQWKLFHTFPLSQQEGCAALRWLAIKIKGAIGYYYTKEGDRKARREWIKKIMANPYYRLLLNDSADPQKASDFSPKERMILSSWRRCGRSAVALFGQVRRAKFYQHQHKA